MSAEESFQERRLVLAAAIWSCLESMNNERGGVNLTDHTEGSVTGTRRLFTDTIYGQEMVVRQTYHIGTTVTGIKADIQRAIEAVIGHTEDWVPVVRIWSSMHAHPLKDIFGGSVAAIEVALRSLHEEIFDGWPPSNDDIEDFKRLNHPEEPE